MSKVVDERVVILNFDNKQFEKNTKQSMKTIKKLKKSMQFDEVSDSINEAYDNTDPSKLLKSIDEVSKKFTAMEVVAFTVINRITNKVLDMGEKLVKSLSIDRVITGWEAYADEVKSVGTLLGQGYDEAMVTKQLELLAKYTDATSYSYTDMTNNISKFTAAGVDLEKATDAMMGIANWAALSGVNAQKASSAMYQLAQAVSAGTVKLQDWKSIQNVSMDTQEFRQHVLDTAVAMGTLKKQANGTYKTLSGKGFTKNQFTTQLSEGWFTSEVLIETLQDYSAAVQEIFDIQEEKHYDNVNQAAADYQRRLSEMKKEAEAVGDTSEATAKKIDEMEFALKAFRSAQEARTFADAINATKDAVTTQWKDTFKAIFGGYNEAKETWTQLSDELWYIFAEGARNRAKALKSWGDAKLVNDAEKAGEIISNLIDNLGDKAMTTEDWNVLSASIEATDEFKEKLIEAGVAAGSLYKDELTGVIHAVDGSVVSVDNFDESLKQGWLTAKSLEKTIEEVEDAEGKLIKQVKDQGQGGRADLFGIVRDEDSGEIIYEQSGAIYNLIGAVKTLVQIVRKAWDGVFGKTSKEMKTITERVRDFSRGVLTKVIDNSSKLENIFKGIFSIGKLVVKLFKGMYIAIKPIINIFGLAGGNVIDTLSDVGSAFSKFVDECTVFEEAGNYLAVYTKKIANFVVAAFVKVVGWIKAAMPTIKKVFSVIKDILKAVFELIAAIVVKIAQFVIKTAKAIKESEIFKKIVSGLVKVLKALANAILLVLGKLKTFVETISKSKIAEVVRKACNTIKNAFMSMFNKLKGVKADDKGNSGALAWLEKLKEKLKVLAPVVEGLKNLWTGIKNLFGPLMRLVGRALTALGNFLTAVGERIQGFLDGKNGLISFSELIKTVFKVGIASILVKWTTSLIGAITKMVDGLSMFLTGFKGHSILERTALALKQFAAAMLMFTAALIILSKLDTNSVAKAMGAIGMILGLYVAFLMSIKKLFVTNERISEGFSLFKKGEGAFTHKGKYTSGPAATISAISGMLLSMAASMLIISMAVKILSKLDENKVNRAITILIVIMGIMSIFLQQLKGFMTNKSMKVAAPGLFAFIGIAILMKSMAKQMVKMSDMQEDAIMRGAAALIAVAAAISIILRAVAKVVQGQNKIGKTTAIVGTLVSLTTLIKKMLNIFTELAKLSWEDFGKGAAGLAIMTGSLAIVLLVIKQFDKDDTKQAKKIIGILLSLVGIFFAMTFVAKELAKLPDDQFTKATQTLGMIIVLLGAILIALKIIGLFEKSKEVNKSVNEKVSKKIAHKFKGIGSVILSMAVAIGIIALSVAYLTKAMSKINDPNAILYAILSLMIISTTMVALTGALIYEVTATKATPQKMAGLSGIISSISGFVLSMAVSISLLATVLQIVRNPKTIGTALAAIYGLSIILMGGMILLVKSVKAGVAEKKLLAVAALMSSMTSLLFSIAVIMIAMSMLAKQENIGAPVAALIVILITLIAGISLILVASKGVDVTKVDKLAILLVAVAASIIIMAAALSMISEISNPKQALQILLTMALILGVFVAAGALLGTVGLDKVLLTLAAAILVFAAAIWLLADAFKIIVDTAEKLNNLDLDPEKMGKNIKAAAQAITENSAAIGEAIGSLILGILEGVWDRIVSFIEKVLTYIGSIAYRLGKIVAELIGGVFKGLAETDAMGSLADMFFDMLSVLMDRLPELADKLIVTALKLLDILIARVPEIMAKLATLAMTVMINFISALADSLEKNADKLIDAFNKLWTAIINFFKKAFGINSPSTLFRDFGKFIVEGFLQGIKNFWTEVKKVFDDVVKNVTNFVKEKIIAPFTEWGKNIVNGLLGGLKSAWDGVTNWCSNAWNGIKDGFCNFFGIHSPSKLFEQYGEYINEGLMNGLEDTTGVERAVEDLSDSVIDTMDNSDINTILSNLLNNLDMADDGIVIKPVLDLTNIQNGASEINRLMSSFNGYAIGGNMSSLASDINSSMNRTNRSNREVGSVNNNTTTNENIYNTFNITGSNAKDIADQVAQVLQDKVERKRKSWA